MPLKQITKVVTTNDSGAADVYTEVVSGRLSAIHYVKDDFSNGVDFTITAESTAQNLWTEENVNASTMRAPRQPTHSQAGAELLYAAGGTPQSDQIVLVKDRIHIVIASGGDTTSGTFIFVLE